jgi:hypothetical protein
MYEDEYDDTYDTSGMNLKGIDTHLLDELEEEDFFNDQTTQVFIGFDMQIFLCALSLLTMLKGRSHYRI